ncbi:MAG: TAXI family TRAP transporter solute-binding subunit [Myxococcales bacterium]
MRRFAVLAVSVVALLSRSAGAQGQPVNINVATATTGGAYYPIGNAIAQLWNDTVPGVRASAQATNGTPHNIQLMARKEAEVAIAQVGVVYQAVNGVEAYKEQGKQTHFKAMTQLYPNVMQWIVRKELDVKDLAGLKGKKVIPGAQNSATELNSREMFGVLGLDYRTRSDVKADYMDYNQAVDQLKNKHAEATLLAGGVPTAAVIDIMTSGEGRLLSLPDDYIKQLVAKYPWYSPFTIPAGSYPKQERAVKTVAVTNILLVRNDLPEPLVHDLLAAMYADAPRLASAHAAMKAFKLDDALLGIKGVIDLHPGAARFFKEKGIAK